MPYFSIETNKDLDAVSTQALVKKTSTYIARMLGKPEQFVMIAIKPGTSLTFSGSDELAAFVQLKSIGLPRDRCSEFSGHICDFIKEELDIPEDRIFVDFQDLERNMFGWNGKTF